MAIKPNERKVELWAVNGDMLCKYVGEHFGIDDGEVYNIIMEHYLNTPCIGVDDALFELIIEEEDYCNDEGQYYRVLEFIADEFGGHFNINFLSMTAYL